MRARRPLIRLMALLLVLALGLPSPAFALRAPNARNAAGLEEELHTALDSSATGLEENQKVIRAYGPDEWRAVAVRLLKALRPALQADQAMNTAGVVTLTLYKTSQLLGRQPTVSFLAKPTVLTALNRALETILAFRRPPAENDPTYEAWSAAEALRVLQPPVTRVAVVKGPARRGHWRLDLQTPDWVKPLLSDTPPPGTRWVGWRAVPESQLVEEVFVRQESPRRAGRAQRIGRFFHVALTNESGDTWRGRLIADRSSSVDSSGLQVLVDAITREPRKRIPETPTGGLEEPGAAQGVGARGRAIQREVALMQAVDAWQQLSVEPAPRAKATGLLLVFVTRETRAAIPLAARAGVPFVVVSRSKRERRAIRQLIRPFGERPPVVQSIIPAGQTFSIYRVDSKDPDWFEKFLNVLGDAGAKIPPREQVEPLLRATENYFKFA